MIPSSFMLLEKGPLTPNGKLDRRALPDPGHQRSALETVRVGRSTAVEETRVRIWSKVLGLSEVGIHDNFFQAGRPFAFSHGDLTGACSFQSRDPTTYVLRRADHCQARGQCRSRFRDKSESQIPPIRPVARSAELPLSFAQQRLWFWISWNRQVHSITYHRCCGSTGGWTWQCCIERCLKWCMQKCCAPFPSVDGHPQQRIVERWEPSLPVIDLSALDQAAGEEMARGWHSARRCSLSTWRQDRCCERRLRLGAEDHVLLFTTHHIVSDAWSIGVLVKEVAALYKAYERGLESPLAELAVQYADYAVWQREWLIGEVLEQQLAYWRKRLANAPPVLTLPTDHPRPRVQNYRGAATHHFAQCRVDERAQRIIGPRRGDIVHDLVGGVQGAVVAAERAEDISVGTAIANRTRQETEGANRIFVNTLVMRTEVRGELSFNEFLRQVREVCLGAYGHQEVPFEGW